MNRTYEATFDKMLKINPSSCTFEMFFPMLKENILFSDIPCISTGETKKVISDISEIKTVLVIKMRKQDIEKSTYDTQNPSIGVLTAPTSSLKTLLKAVHINDSKYTIVTEKNSGFSFSDVIALYLERCS